MFKISRKKKIAGIGVLAAGTLVAGIAGAAWQAGGTGAAYAKATTAQALTFNDLSSTVSGALAPGQNADVVLTIHNSNAYKIDVTLARTSDPITSDKGAACTDVVGSTHATGVSVTVPATTYHLVPGDNAITLTNAAHMTDSSDNGCQGAVFTVPLSATGQSAGN